MRSAAELIRKTLAALLALSIGLGPAALSPAQEAPKVALVPLTPLFAGVPQATADRVSELLAKELRRQEGLTLVPLGEHPSAVPAQAPRPSDRTDDDEGGGDSGAAASGVPFQGAGARALAKAQAQVAKGKRDMQRLRFDAAAQEFQDGIAGLEGSFDLLPDLDGLVEAYLQLAIAELRLGHKDSGQQALEAVVRLAPDRPLSGPYPAVFTRLFASTRQRLTTGDKGTLAATSTPAGQLVKVDGRDAGATPVSLELIVGTHFVIVGADSGKVAYKVDLSPGATVQIGTGAAPEHHVVRAVARADEPPVPRVEAPSPTPPVPIKPQAPLAKVIAEIAVNNIDDAGGRSLEQLAMASGAQAVLFGGLHFADDSQTELALDCMLYSLETREVAALNRVQFDADLSGAPVELLKVTSEVAQKLLHWSDVVGLPQPVAPGVKAPKVGAKKVAGANEARRDEGDELVVAKHTRKLEAQEGPDLGPPPEVARSEGGSFPWLAVGVGVGIAAVVAVAAVLIVGAATTKAGSTPQVTW